MPFLIYFVVLIVTAGAALFGLDVLTAPLPEHNPVVPLISAASAPNKLAKREAERAERDTAANKVLTPIYPANPGGVRIVAPTGPSAAETSGVVPALARVADTTAAAGQTRPHQQMVQVSRRPEKLATTPNTSPVELQAVRLAPPEQTVTQQFADNCDIEACARAYRSFRVSDCSYQPFEGPRRACVAPPASYSGRLASNFRTRAGTHNGP